MKERIEKLAMIADPTGKFWNYLQSNTFLTDPASIRNHGSHAGGLAFHSAEVFVHLHRLSGESVQACAQIALGHDLCKVGSYAMCMKSEKVRNTDGSFATDSRGKAIWREVEAYEHVASTMPLGHGDSSMMRLIQASGTPIPKPVILAIRWHMGAYGASQGEEWTRMGEAMAVSSLVIYTQTADLLSTYRPMTEAELIDYIDRAIEKAQRDPQ